MSPTSYQTALPRNHLIWKGSIGLLVVIVKESKRESDRKPSPATVRASPNVSADLRQGKVDYGFYFDVALGELGSILFGAVVMQAAGDAIDHRHASEDSFHLIGIVDEPDADFFGLEHAGLLHP